MKNPVIAEAGQVLAQSSAEGLLMGVMTAAFLTFFLGWAIWAWLPSNRQKMEAAARMPLDDEHPDGAPA